MIQSYLNTAAGKTPDAVAYIKGSVAYPMLRGRARFYTAEEGVLVYTEVYGLPSDYVRPFRVFAYHIHDGMRCAGTPQDPFADTLGHYNPDNSPHPYHAGDLPPLFSNYGYALGSVLTARFKLNQIIGKAVVVHAKPDDFTTQPSGTSGDKIACGIIERVFR